MLAVMTLFYDFIVKDSRITMVVLAYFISKFILNMHTQTQGKKKSKIPYYANVFTHTIMLIISFFLYPKKI